MVRILTFSLFAMALLLNTACEKEAEKLPPTDTSATPGPQKVIDEAKNADDERGTTSVSNAETCEQAYADLEELVAGLEEQLGESDSEMPEREAFLETCASLPEEVQECMVYEYAIANKEACEKAREALDPDERTRADELMGK